MDKVKLNKKDEARYHRALSTFRGAVATFNRRTDEATIALAKRALAFRRAIPKAVNVKEAVSAANVSWAVWSRLLSIGTRIALGNELPSDCHGVTAMSAWASGKPYLPDTTPTKATDPAKATKATDPAKATEASGVKPVATPKVGADGKAAADPANPYRVAKDAPLRYLADILLARLGSAGEKEIADAVVSLEAVSDKLTECLTAAMAAAA